MLLIFTILMGIVLGVLFGSFVWAESGDGLYGFFAGLIIFLICLAVWGSTKLEREHMDLNKDAYKLSECLRGGGAKCPFCGSYGLDKGIVDETKLGKLCQHITCYDCKESWTIEYIPALIKYKGQLAGIFDHWPTTQQISS